jgi:DnaJ C terminal domain
MQVHPRMATSSTPSANGTGPHEDLHALLERLLTPIEDLVDVMGVPLEPVGREDVEEDAALPATVAPTAGSTTTVVVRETVARDGGRTEVGVAALAECPSCGGVGWEGDDAARCGACRGSGRVQEKRQLEVDIPAGVVTGDLLRLSGEAAVGGSLAGDLLLQVLVIADDARTGVRDVAATPVEKPKRFRRRRRR